jgi:signal transduction histidine kinase
MNEQYLELAELAGGFIHEIKNHLGTLGLNLQLLAEDFQDPKSQRDRRAQERVGKLQTECQRLVELSNDFLRFARLKDLNRTSASLAKLIEELVDFFLPTARQSRIDIKCFVPTDLPAVNVDVELFKQALLNLLLNAQQAMPEGGALTIQAGVIADCGLRMADSPQSVIELGMIDTGAGMPPEVLAKVFKPFFSTKPGGSGLGLATTRRIVAAHGGSIDVQSEVGRGTKFTIRLPVASGRECPAVDS